MKLAFKRDLRNFDKILKEIIRNLIASLKFIYKLNLYIILLLLYAHIYTYSIVIIPYTYIWLPFGGPSKSMPQFLPFFLEGSAFGQIEMSPYGAHTL